MTPKELDSLKWAIAEIRERMESGFHGDILFKLNDGRIVLTEVKEQKKPPR